MLISSDTTITFDTCTIRMSSLSFVHATFIVICAHLTGLLLKWTLTISRGKKWLSTTTTDFDVTTVQPFVYCIRALICIFLNIIIALVYWYNCCCWWCRLFSLWRCSCVAVISIVLAKWQRWVRAQRNWVS